MVAQIGDDGWLIGSFFDRSFGEWSRLVRLGRAASGVLDRRCGRDSIYRLVNEYFPEYPYWSDRELFYGVLEEGEMFEWEDWSVAGSGLWKMVMRTSKNPVPIGLDGLQSQQEERFQLAGLVYTLTPEQGRGIPYWLDIVDRQVRVTNPLVQTMVEQYIDPNSIGILQLKTRRENHLVR